MGGKGCGHAHRTTMTFCMQETLPMDDTPQTMSGPPMEPSRDGPDGGWIESPIDDETYDVLMALASKLEAIDTYRTYAADGNAGLWQELAQDEGRHAERLVTELRQRLAG
jgi:hypothetical protein